MSEAYFQFPLCALAFEAELKARLGNIILFGVVEAGLTFYNRLTSESCQAKAEQFARLSTTPRDFKKGKAEHVATMLGAEAIGVRVNSLAYPLEQWKRLRGFNESFAQKHGRDVEVRVRKDLVFECRDNCGISYREFAVLSAVYSCIGAKSYPVRVTRQQIQCRMLGYKSPAVMQAEIASRTDGATPLTLRQINYTLNALHERGFFARTRANERQTYYSHRMTLEEMEARLLKSKTYSDNFHKERRQRETRFIQEMKASKAAIKADSPIKADKRKRNGSNGVRCVSPVVSARASAECPL